MSRCFLCSLSIWILLLLWSCTDPKKTGKARAGHEAASPGSKVLEPVTTPLRVREQLRQKIRMLNHQAQLKAQKIRSIQSGTGR